MDTGYRGEMQGLVLQLRLMALGLLILEQNVLWTIFISAFFLQPNLVYCFPAEKNNRDNYQVAVTGVTTAKHRDDNHQFRPPPQGLEQCDHFFSAHS